MQDANMKKAPSVRELSEKRTEREKLALFKTLDKGNALSPTRFAGPLTRPDPSVASRHLPTLWGVTLPEGANVGCSLINIIPRFCNIRTPSVVFQMSPTAAGAANLQEREMQ